MQINVVRILPALSCASLILVLSLLPDLDPVETGIPFMDKIAHAGAYCALGFLVLIPFAADTRRTLPLYLATVAGCLLYGGAIELLQGLTGRTPDVLDFSANGFGALTGTGAALLAVRVRRKLRLGRRV